MFNSASIRHLLLATALLALCTHDARADDTLQNDNFVSGDMAACEQGFGSNDIGASRFLAPDAGRQLLKLQLIFGPDDGTGGTTQYPMTLEVYDDSAGTDTPGTSLYNADFDLVASSSALQEIDVSADNVVVPQQFRVGLVFQHAGSPGLCRDDGTALHASMNYIYNAPTTTWGTAESFGVVGNWIFRAVVSGTGGASDAGITMDAAGDITCTGNGGCPVGQFCDTTSHSCTFDCRTASDCGGGGASCNSLGMCVNGESGGKGGCCRADSGGGGGAAVLAIGVLGILHRRRRARA